MPTLIANKSMKYGTRHLRAGDEFDATQAHARWLIGTRLAGNKPIAAGPETSTQQQPRPAQTQHGIPSASDLQAARRDYETAIGEVPDMRWGAMRVREEIAKRASSAAADDDGEVML